MNSESNKSFYSFLIDPPISSGILETNIYRNDKEIDYICYVEGPTDSYFYNNIKNEVLNNKKLEFIGMPISSDNISNDEIGKEGVIKKYYGIFSMPNYKELLKKSIFIIDHDFEGLVSERYSPIELDNSVFTITKYYAFENYFLVKRNLKKIFDYFNIDNNSYNDFVKYLDIMVCETSRYTRLKSAVTIACKKGKYQTFLPSSKCIIPSGKLEGKVMKPDNIFHFNFNKKYQHFYNINFLNLQSDAMWNAIKNNKKILNYFNYESLKFKNKMEFTRGHDVYKLLEEYLKQVHKINISQKRYQKDSRYIEIVKIIDVDINFVNGLGEKLNN